MAVTTYVNPDVMLWNAHDAFPQCDGKFAVEGAYDFDKAEFHLAQVRMMRG